jgi:hypothetical protein
MFKKKDVAYNMRDEHILELPTFKKITYGRNTFSYYGAHLWNNLPNKIKNGVTDIKMFKSLLGAWDGPNCNCSSCTFM